MVPVAQSYVRFSTAGCAEKLLEAATLLEEKLMGVSFVAVSGQCWLTKRWNLELFLLFTTPLYLAQRKRRKTISERPKLLGSRGGVERKRNGHEGKTRSEIGPGTISMSTRLV